VREGGGEPHADVNRHPTLVPSVLKVTINGVSIKQVIITCKLNLCDSKKCLQ